MRVLFAPLRRTEPATRRPAQSAGQPAFRSPCRLSRSPYCSACSTGPARRRWPPSAYCTWFNRRRAGQARPARTTTIEDRHFPRQTHRGARAEEAKYRDVEYSLRITTRSVDPKTQKDLPAIQSQETRRVVLQGNLIWFSGESTRRVFDADFARDEVSAYDGRQTLTVLAGNSANIHLGRFEHADIYPAHTISLIHYRLNFPLSVYLSGDEGIHSHPKLRHLPRSRGSIYEFAKVEARVEGEDQLDGLRCLKLRVNRWYSSNDVPVLQYLWLAPERNYHCLKEQLSWPSSHFGDFPMHEMHVDKLREIAPGLWFPVRITVIDYDRQALQQKKSVIESRTETIVARADPRPHHDVAFFRHVVIPAGLPVFTIRDRAIVGASLPEPIADEAKEKAKLEEIVARVREEEQRYTDLEVTASADFKNVGVNMLMEGLITEQKRQARSVVHGQLAFFTQRDSDIALGHEPSERSEVQALDGEWTRTLRHSVGQGRERRWASLRKGGGGKTEGRHEGVPALRPHTFLLREQLALRAAC